MSESERFAHMSDKFISLVCITHTMLSFSIPTVKYTFYFLEIKHSVNHMVTH